MTDPAEIHPDRARLNDLVFHCEKRVRRAGEKLTIAERENSDAQHALATARARLAAWIEANPEPQLELI